MVFWCLQCWNCAYTQAQSSDLFLKGLPSKFMSLVFCIILLPCLEQPPLNKTITGQAFTLQGDKRILFLALLFFKTLVIADQLLLMQWV